MPGNRMAAAVLLAALFADPAACQRGATISVRQAVG